MAKSKKTRKRYSPEKRAQILAAASKEGLTAAAVQKRFGVSAVTYYSWRKKAAGPGRKGRRPAARAGRDGALSSQIRGAVENRMRDLLPKLVEREIDRYLDVALGSEGRGRR